MSASKRGGSTAKAFAGQIYSALQSSSRSTPTINGVECSRLWVQVHLQVEYLGVVVATSEDRKQCTVDDGTGVLRLELKVFLKNAPPGVEARPQLGQWVKSNASKGHVELGADFLCLLALGDYIMAIGPMQKNKTDAAVSVRTLVAHQVVKLDAKLQREPMWFLEVIEYWTSVVNIPAT
ncbi:RecQ-mediated genome instability protein 2 [Phytophthora cactorum]|nr:RecQ-mediated genome instability protein 2 [Phytophthora cactorum]